MPSTNFLLSHLNYDSKLVFIKMFLCKKTSGSAMKSLDLKVFHWVLSNTIGTNNIPKASWDDSAKLSILIAAPKRRVFNCYYFSACELILISTRLRNLILCWSIIVVYLAKRCTSKNCSTVEQSCQHSQHGSGPINMKLNFYIFSFHHQRRNEPAEEDYDLDLPDGSGTPSRLVFKFIHPRIVDCYAHTHHLAMPSSNVLLYLLHSTDSLFVRNKASL